MEWVPLLTVAAVLFATRQQECHAFRTTAGFSQRRLVWQNKKKLLVQSSAFQDVPREDSDWKGQNHNRQDSYEPPFYRRRIASGFDTDVMPKRLSSNVPLSDTQGESLPEFWGIEQQRSEVPVFPDSMESVADAAFQAIAGTLYQQQELDPNTASNAMAHNVLFDYRPTLSAQNTGRLGIELDGVGSLMANSTISRSRGSAMRRLILVLASKLSENKQWKAYETKTTPTKTRPVVVYFNTVKQALSATSLLQQLREQQQQSSSSTNLVLDNISIRSLGQGDELPLEMAQQSPVPLKRMGRKPKPPLESGVDPTRGLVVVVQPTDFNDEYRPPGPALGILGNFQILAARAARAELPVIMISPRFSAASASSSDASRRRGSTSQTSNSYHQAATYGGREPPNDGRPSSPWILRDFMPPVYCWVGRALTLSARERFQLQQRPEHHEHYRDIHHGSLQKESGLELVSFPHSHMALVQSVMEEGHPWHVFAARRGRTQSENTDEDLTGNARQVSYEYLASTKSASGRPTQDVMRHILQEYASSATATSK